jgi:Kef-type K+ transport system membrane component KefB
MNDFLQFIFILSIILFASKLAGYLSTLIGQPSVLGELLIGLLLGPSLLDITHSAGITNLHLNEFIVDLGEIGVLFLMFLAGFELHFSDLVRNSKVSVVAGTMGVIIPVSLGLITGLLLKMSFQSAFFLGLALGATSVSISAQTLMEMRVLRSRVGLGLLGAAVFDDILVILLLSVFLALNSGTGIVEILWVLARMGAFFTLSFAFGIWVLPPLARLIARLPISQGLLTLAVLIILIYGLTAEVVGGMAAITGTFIAGLVFSRLPEKQQLDQGLHALAYSVFVPIFFISIGLKVNLREMQLDSLLPFLLISIIAIIGKITGAGAGARLSNYSWKESLQLGIGMISRGEVGLIIASVGLSQAWINNSIFSILIGVVILTTLVTPPLLRFSFRQFKRDKNQAENFSQEVS